MRAISLTLALLVVAVTAADARHRHRHRYFDATEFMEGSAYTNGAARDEERSRRLTQDNPPIVPSDWQVEPEDPNWKGKRFMSAERDAWFASYSSPVKKEPIAAHMKAVAFADDKEVVTYLRAERDWIVAAGFKDDRMFYRKAVVACGGTTWHHIAFEYPPAKQRAMDRFVARASAAVDRAENEGCDSPTARN